MTNKELELIGQLTEVAMTVAELKAENKILKDINEKLMQALRIQDVLGQSKQLVCDNHRPDLEHFMKYSESICKNCKQKV